MGETKSDPPKVKVVDRRKFSADGEPLEKPQSTPGRAAPAGMSEGRGAERDGSAPKQDAVSPPTTKPRNGSHLFLELVTMLASQAELLLVGTDDLPAQPAEAQRVIDYLGVLEKKTAGNLSDDEARVLSSILYQLRTIFLQRK